MKRTHTHTAACTHTLTTSGVHVSRSVRRMATGAGGMVTCQWWKTDRAKAWPCVCVRRSVSKPNESMAGMKALMV